MNKLEEVIHMIMDEFKQEYGQDAKLEPGDEITSVFNDGVVILSNDDGQMKVKILAGKPYYFDYDLNLTKK